MDTRDFFSLKWVIVLLMMCGGNAAWAQPAIKLAAYPDIRILPVALNLPPIWIVAKRSDEQLPLKWEINGPGEFRREDMQGVGIYQPPDRIAGASATATITATITDPEGRQTADSLTFTLLAPLPPPLPTPAPAAAAVPLKLRIKEKDGSSKKASYAVKPGEKLTFQVEMSSPNASNLSLECSAVFSKPTCQQGEIIYTAPPDKPTGRDLITIRVVDRQTGKYVGQDVISIEIESAK
jgi:hypothetical protein